MEASVASSGICLPPSVVYKPSVGSGRRASVSGKKSAITCIYDIWRLGCLRS